MLGSLARNLHYGQPPFLPEVQQHPVEKRYYVPLLLLAPPAQDQYEPPSHS